MKKIYRHIRKKIRHFLSYICIGHRSSAGGICLRERKNVREILCIMHKKGWLMLPKGSLHTGESLEKAAKREFEEETGLYGYHLGEKVGVLRDFMKRKKITFFWFEKPSNKHSELRDEAIVWVPLTEVYDKMHHKSERKFLKRYVLNRS